jgi:type I restriction enzyme S subunit
MDKVYPYYGAASLMDYVDGYLFDGIYLLLGEDGTVVDELGFPILQYVWGKFWVNNHAHILTGKNGFSTETLYVLLKQTSVKSIVTGAVQPKISQANLKNISVTIPPIHQLSKYNEVIEPLFKTIRKNNDESSRLATLRDTLLPKLMNGEIKIAE